MAISGPELVMLSVVALLLLVNMVASMRQWLSYLSILRRLCCENWCHLRRLLSCRRDDVQEGDLVSEQMSKIIRDRVAANMLEMVSLFHIVIFAAMMSICMNTLSRSPRWMSFKQDVVLIVCFGSTTLLRNVLRPMAVARPVAVYIFMMTGLCAFVAASENSVDLLFRSEGLIMFMRGALTFRFHMIGVASLTNMGYFATFVVVSVNQFPGASKNLIIYQFWATLFMLIVSSFSMQAAQEQTRREVETLTLRSESSGLWNLLDLVCDVVISLDGRLRIVGNASRFSALVMLQGKSSEGMDLTAFMTAEADRETFERCASSPSHSLAEETQPRAIHVKLRDGLGNLIPVELFCVRVQHLVGTTHFVGIREFSDFAPIPECKRFGSGPSRRQPTAAAGIGVGAIAGVSDDAGDSATLSSSSDGSVPPPLVPDAQCSPVPSRLTMQETTNEAVQLALLRLLRMLSIGMDASNDAEDSQSGEWRSCCPFHTRSSWIRRAMHSLETMPCMPRLKPISSQQCSVCGLLADPAGRRASDSGRCFACSAVITYELGPRQSL